MDKNIFPKRLKEERKRCKLTQQQLADEINYETNKNKITRTSITRYESGTRKPDLETLSAISDILDVDTDYLLGLTNKRHLIALNEQLDIFSNFINLISQKDDLAINDNLWKILDIIKNMINLSIENNLLNITTDIFNKINFIYNKSLNSEHKKLDFIKDLTFSLSNIQNEIGKNDFMYLMKSVFIEKVPKILNNINSLNIDEIPDIDKHILYTYYSCFTNEEIPENIKPILKEHVNKIRQSKEDNLKNLFNNIDLT